MLGNYLSAALRNLARNRLHSVITTASLAIGFSAVLFAILYARFEYGYDRFWPDAQRLYMAVSRTASPGRGIDTTAEIRARRAPLISSEVPGVEALARIAHESVQVQVGEAVYPAQRAFWADPNLFSVLKPKVLAGDVAASLADPAAAVLSRTQAMDLFGEATPIGQTFTIKTTGRAEPETIVLRVGAVIADFPRQSHLNESAIYLPGATQASRLADGEAMTLTYLRTRPGVSQASLDAAFKGLSQHHLPRVDGVDAQLVAAPIAGVYMLQELQPNFGPGAGETLRQGHRSNILLFAGLAGLILAVGAVNFVTLMTARGAGRAVEVGVRKAAGARRRDLVAQFVGEAMIYSVLALLVGIALTELALPLINTLTGQAFRLNYMADASILAALLLGAILLGAVAGLYPALALSAFRPANVLKGGMTRTPGSALLRQIMIAVQFVPLVALALVALMVHLQTHQIGANAVKMDDPDGLLIEEACTPALKTRIAAVPGVRSADCVTIDGLSFSLVTGGLETGDESHATALSLSHRDVDVEATLTEPAELAFHDLKLAAGRMWANTNDEASVLINETVAKSLGYRDPAAAVGQTLEWRIGAKGPMRRTTILGVTRDRGGFAGYEQPVYYIDRSVRRDLGIGVKLAREGRPATLAAIDRAWRETGAKRPIKRSFYGEMIAKNMAMITRVFGMVTACIGVGVIVAVLGLFGLAAFLAEQRTKEIGVRKALGAGRGQLMRLLLFQFARPVIIANLISAPLVYTGLTLLVRLANDPQIRITTGPAPLVIVLTGSLLLAFAATFHHAWRVTGARPVTALRYE